MDGNGRWAKRRGLPRSAGHRAGANTVKKLVEDCDKIGLKYLTVFTFSTENWKRSEKEINNIMVLIREFLAYTEKQLRDSNVRVKFIGLRNRLDKDIQRDMERTEASTANKTGLTFIIALDYGSRNEITEAVKCISQKCIDGDIDVNSIDEDTIANHLFTVGIPDPDLMIRSSGEKRMSNYLLWQASYSELWFSDVLWPDFSIKHLLKAVREYNNRNRRFGGAK
ncbi:MAG: di-trans,poly-cis-decaprenylcistransferase, partial [Clostridiales bacterium]|nr:di-trans,poly-cis-decaprenylcistransferase [Clostridiales bacterium]